MKKLNFEKFAINKIQVGQLKSIKGGDTAGGGEFRTTGTLPNLVDVYCEWSSDYTDSNGDQRVRGYKETVFTGCE